MQIGWATKDSTFLNHVNILVFEVMREKLKMFRSVNPICQLIAGGLWHWRRSVFFSL